MALYHIENVTPVNKAVSDTSNKSLGLSIKKRGLAAHSFYSEFPDKICVKTVSLDDYVTSIGIENVDVVKLTINRHEPEALNGAKNLLRSVRNVVFQSARYQEVISFLSKEGFFVKESVDVGIDVRGKAVLMEKG